MPRPRTFDEFHRSRSAQRRYRAARRQGSSPSESRIMALVGALGSHPLALGLGAVLVLALVALGIALWLSATWREDDALRAAVVLGGIWLVLRVVIGLVFLAYASLGVVSLQRDGARTESYLAPCVVGMFAVVLLAESAAGGIGIGLGLVAAAVIVSKWRREPTGDSASNVAGDDPTAP